MKKVAIWISVILVGFTGCGILGFTFISEPMPEGIKGPKADSLATEVLRATGYENWEKTGAVKFDFRGSHDFIWDVKRNYAQVSWKNKRVLLNLSDQQGVVYKDGEKQEDAQKALDMAWALWCNDSFWFMAHHKLFDPGTERQYVVLEDSSEALLVTYMEGGVTPGDSYLWLLDENRRPTGWKMWVKILPVGGMYFSWEKWKELETGVWVATEHNTDIAGVPIGNPEAAADLLDLTDGVDIFAELEQ